MQSSYFLLNYVKAFSSCLSRTPAMSILVVSEQKMLVFQDTHSGAWCEEGMWVWGLAGTHFHCTARKGIIAKVNITHKIKSHRQT